VPSVAVWAFGSGIEEVQECSGHVLRGFVDHEVADGQCVTLRTERTAAPQGQDVVVVAHEAVLAPKNEYGAGDRSVSVLLVVLEIDAGSGAVVLAARVNRRWITESREVGVQRVLPRSDGCSSPVIPNILRHGLLGVAPVLGIPWRLAAPASPTPLVVQRE
jgi:hypothetical protein